MADPKQVVVTCCEHANVKAFAREATAVTTKGGWLDQAIAAQKSGTFLDFITKLMAQLGPILGPIILSIIQGLIPHVPVPVPPTPTPAA